MTNEAFSRVKIDAQLRDQGWAVENPNAIRYEYVLQDGTKADYVLNDRHGRAVAVLEAKRTSVSLAEGEAQAVGYAVDFSGSCLILHKLMSNRIMRRFRLPLFRCLVQSEFLVRFIVIENPGFTK